MVNSRPVADARRFGLFGMLVVGLGGGACAARTAPAPALPRAPDKPAPAVSTVAAVPPPADPAAEGEPVARVRVPLGGPAKGPASAKVNLVVFADFECPFSRRAQPTLERLMIEYPRDVRIFFRHQPLPFHTHAALAAEAAVAAGVQGKFWEMHDRLFDGQTALDRANLERYAEEMGLDLGKFRAALDDRTARRVVAADTELAMTIRVAGTPTFFANGRPILGAQPYEEFKRVIDDEIARVDALVARGVAPQEVYATLTRNAAATLPPRDTTSPAASKEVYKLPVGDAPRRGGTWPKVTIVEFADFQCPYCGLVEAVLKQVLHDYGDDVALVFRHQPLAMHAQAMIAAQAAEAARAQDKFWEMHDRLFADQSHFDRAGLEGAAREIGLDMAAFQRALDGNQGSDRIARDVADAARFGARGTPTFFINGRNLRGAQPIEAFRLVIDQEIKKADAKLAAGTPREQLYAALIDGGLDRVPPPEPKTGEVDPAHRYRVEISGAPFQGAKDAPVTIVEWADFECPYCAKAEQTMAAVMKQYKGKVRWVWRDLPLAFHSHAQSAAIAARAAAEQGKFWQMHDRLMADQEHLDRDTFEKYAHAIGLDMARFRRAMDEQRGAQAIDSDVSAGAKVGARGTPTFYINGKYLVGAQPIESFKTVIDAELANGRDMVAHGTPKSRLYDKLMTQAEPTAVYVGSKNTPEELFKGQIVVTKSRLPDHFPSREAFVKAIEESRTTEVWANVDDAGHGWDIEYLAFFAAPLTADTVTVNFYSVSGERNHFISGDNQYPRDSGSRVFVSSIHLARPEFEPGKNYRMTVEVNQKTIASTTFWLVDHPTALRDPAK